MKRKLVFLLSVAVLTVVITTTTISADPNSRVYVRDPDSPWNFNCILSINATLTGFSMPITVTYASVMFGSSCEEIHSVYTTT